MSLSPETRDRVIEVTLVIRRMRDALRGLEIPVRAVVVTLHGFSSQVQEGSGTGRDAMRWTPPEEVR